MPVVILDADFLSSFLKIGRLELVREFYGGQILCIPPAVYREIAQTELLTQLVAVTWIQIATPDAMILSSLTHDDELSGLGAGERESIALALAQPDAVLMMSDNKARRVARRLGVAAVNIPAFLLACKMAGRVDRETLEAIIQGLRDKDYYEFRRDILTALLA